MKFTTPRPISLSLILIFFWGQNTLAQIPHFRSTYFTLTDSLVLTQIKQLSKLTGVHIDSSVQLIYRAGNLPGKSKNESIIPQTAKLSDSPTRIKSLLQWRGGYINYQWNYRSNVDTPFQEQNISQHYLNVNADITIAGWLPIRMTLFHRSSNSAVFSDFTDFRVEYDAYTMQQWQANRVASIRNEMLSKLQNPLPELQANLKKDQVFGLNRLLNQSELRTKYLNAKELVLNPDLASELSGTRDSLLVWSRAYVEVYERLDSLKTFINHEYDSLVQRINEGKATIALIRSSLEKGADSEEGIRRLKNYMKEQGYGDADIRKVDNPLAGIRLLAIGRTVPQYSPLTVSNVNVRGLQIEYAKNGKYAATTAGLIDFRVRDFIYAGTKRTPQFMAVSKVGIGVPEGKHVFVTVFGGKKQLFPSITRNTAFPLIGASLELQYVIARYHRFTAEVAQSKIGTALVYPDSSIKKNGIDKNSRAYRIQWRTYLPRMKTVLNAMYIHQGVNFQSFTNIRSNAEVERWNVSLEQKLFRNLISLVGSLQKNDFSNPYILQRYDANNIYATAGITMRKMKWPTLHFSYAPGSQMSVIDSVIYENRFQALNMNASYPFKIGTARSNTVLAFSKFYNNNQDTGFLYYNASNVFFTQDLSFRVLRLNWGFSYMDNGSMHYTVMEAGAQFPVWKRSVVFGGVKINKLGLEKPKLGFYLNTRVAVASVGELNVWMEQNYLPGIEQTLVRNAFFNIGFTRYFTPNRIRS